MTVVIPSPRIQRLVGDPGCESSRSGIAERGGQEEDRRSETRLHFADLSDNTEG